jgi:ABC-2 type transport system ATP-binding protein
MHATDSPLLEVEQVRKSFGDIHAVDGVTLRARPGEVLALLGPNGAGKTTLLRMIIGMIRPDAGTIRYRLGDDGPGGPAAAASTATLDPALVGYLPEERGLYQDVPVRRVLLYFAALRGMRRQDARGEAGRWLERVGLLDRAGEELRALSKGNQQKVQFISAIIHRPRLVVLDEPFSGLDPLNQEFFLELIRELRAAGAAVLLSAHQMQLVERLADRILLIRHGRPAAEGSVAELRRAWRAGRRLRVRLAGRPELGFLAAVPGVRGARHAGDGHAEVDVVEDAPLGPLLQALGTHLDVLDVHAESVTLHDIYVRTVGGAGGAGGAGGGAPEAQP